MLQKIILWSYTRLYLYEEASCNLERVEVVADVTIRPTTHILPFKSQTSLTIFDSGSMSPTFWRSWFGELLEIYRYRS